MDKISQVRKNHLFGALKPPNNSHILCLHQGTISEQFELFRQIYAFSWTFIQFLCLTLAFNIMFTI